MLVPDSGPVRSYRIQKKWLLMALFFSVLLLGLGAWGVYSAYQAERLAILLEKTQHTLSLVHGHQTYDYLNMQSKLDAEHEKLAVYSRNLGELNARMVRLDALGKHLDSQNLSQRIVSMSSQLTHLDAQLVAIDMLLQGDRAKKAARPHAWPTVHGWLSSPFGMRDDPFTSELEMHKGVDIANRLGAPVLAASRGVVVFAGKMNGYGNLIEIEHGYGYRTRYAHMSASVVKVGDIVKDSQLIGRVGSVGRSTGPHLHFEVLRFGEQINPQPFLPHV